MSIINCSRKSEELLRHPFHLVDVDYEELLRHLFHLVDVDYDMKFFGLSGSFSPSASPPCSIFSIFLLFESSYLPIFACLR